MTLEAPGTGDTHRLPPRLPIAQRKATRNSGPPPALGFSCPPGGVPAPCPLTAWKQERGARRARGRIQAGGAAPPDEHQRDRGSWKTVGASRGAETGVLTNSVVGLEVIRSAWCTFIYPASLQAKDFTRSQTRQVSTPFAVAPGERPNSHEHAQAIQDQQENRQGTVFSRKVLNATMLQ